ncbi:Na+/H+ antiporter family protein [Priestia sp. Y58]|uniref:Na+/H+ antiporter family protein n=1 Tax=Priestia TaxID=2800373 RepID=UPI001C8E4660|nr:MULTISPECIES: Na+/H+ antiporter family protein [Priestia]MBX9983868.1 Na+/H+ antiporter family protein [Priestia aryabhattai]MBY0002856.1 Na+/H+ antiporter family protein [Priestia aryabhattai]MDG0031462.1 Na+/H+ antiporter family protein [Priestia sp. Y58]MDG0061293.1 Na+/H+ antiporter family protein [Priestia sp. P5]
MNAVLIAVLVMLILSLLRINVVFSLAVGALIGGLVGGISLTDTVSIYTDGLGNSASVALSYALLGGFAMAVSRTGLPDAVVQLALKIVGKEGETKKKSLSKVLILLIILIISCFSQNVIPVHIAFIPLLIPPLLKVFNQLKIDRRLVATVITFGLITPYMYFPAGFGKIYHDILFTNIKESGLTIDKGDITTAMALPALGMVVGLLFAVFISYRKPRSYEDIDIDQGAEERTGYTTRGIIVALLAIVAALTVQLLVDSMIFGALAGIVVVYFSGALKWNEADPVLTNGMRMMAFIGFVMLSASGFAKVLQETGDVEALVKGSVALIGGNQMLGAFLMLVIGLLVTMGIGSSFSTIPIIATIFVPLCLELGMSPMATICIVGTAGALGDAGSPASDSTLGPTSGLAVDRQHDHIWDTCVPTFLHYNIPLIIFGWIASVIL